MIEILKGKVIKFITGDDYKVIINIGASQGVKDEMPFIIYYEGEEIIDPDTQKKLGKLEHIKAKVRVIQVSAMYSTLESDSYDKRLSYLDILHAQRMHAYKKRPLDLAENEENELNIESVSNKIHIGDLVRSDPSREK